MAYVPGPVKEKDHKEITIVAASLLLFLDYRRFLPDNAEDLKDPPVWAKRRADLARRFCMRHTCLMSQRANYHNFVVRTAGSLLAGLHRDDTR